jgi:hypothetical protein
VSSIVNAAIAVWTNTASYLTFTQLAKSNALDLGVLTIFANDCHGRITDPGFDASRARTRNLQQKYNSSRGFCGVAEAVHEFGHVLSKRACIVLLLLTWIGLVHEPKRPDRENFVHFVCENLRPDCNPGSMMPPGVDCCATSTPGCCNTRPNFDIESSSLFNSRGPNDITSLMQYKVDAFATDSSNPTMKAVGPGIVVPLTNPSLPSSQDFDRICSMYSPWCLKARKCTSIGCPDHCAIITPCPGNPRCSGLPVFAPRCCEAGELNFLCRQARERCTREGAISCSEFVVALYV